MCRRYNGEFEGNKFEGNNAFQRMICKWYKANYETLIKIWNI